MNALTTLIENWLDTLGAHSTTLKTVTGRDVDSLVLVLEAHWRARPEAWQASADTLRKLKEQRAYYLNWVSGPNGYNNGIGEIRLEGFGQALSILGLYDAVAGTEVKP